MTFESYAKRYPLTGHGLRFKLIIQFASYVLDVSFFLCIQGGPERMQQL